MSLLVLSAQDVDSASATFDIKDWILSAAPVFVQLDNMTKGLSNDIILPHRSSVSTESYTALFMPTRMARTETTIKVVSVPKRNTGVGLSATTLVLDENSGVVKAVINASNLTALRNAAGSLLATQTVGPPRPKVLVVFGAGRQIAAHAQLFLKAYSCINRCVIVNRSLNSRTDNLCASLRSQFPNIRIELGKAVDGIAENGFDLEQAVRDADVICTATSSTEPLFDSDWVKPGAHINLIGSYTPEMREVDGDLFKRSGVVIVDSKDACLIEAGELIRAGMTPDDLVQLGELVDIDGQPNSGRILEVGLKSPGIVTIFKSVGLGLQDNAIANLILERAKFLGLGTTIQKYN